MSEDNSLNETILDETTPRVAPIMPSAWDDTIKDALGAFPKSFDYVWSGWNKGGEIPRGAHVLGTMAHHPALAKAFMTFNAHVAGPSTLSIRAREIIVLRISWLRRAEYEFVQHISLGKRAGLSDADIERIQAGPAAVGWDAVELEVVRAVDELYADGRIARTTWDRLRSHFSIAQIMDAIFLVGCYDMLGMAIASLNMQLEPSVTPLDPATRARMLERNLPSRTPRPAYVLCLREEPVHDAADLAIYSRMNREAPRDPKLTPLVVYGATEAMEGNAPDGMVLLQFPTVEDAKAWYHSPNYQAAIPHRKNGANYRVMIIQGL